MRSNRVAIIIACLMVAASVGSIVARPSKKLTDELPPSPLAVIVPGQFGDWRERSQSFVQVVNPQTQRLLERLYSEILNRIYVNGEGYRIMLSIAYGSDQRGELQAHKPESCYPSQGFTLHKNKPGELVTAHGSIKVRRLYATLQERQEPVTYWFTVGGKTVESRTQKRLVDLRYGLTGRIPDGMLFRVSSIDADLDRAYRLQDHFVNQLLDSLPPAERRRLSGLGGPQFPAGHAPHVGMSP